MTIEHIHHTTGIIVDVVITIGAIAAAIKFRMYNILGRRWRTDVASTHFDLHDGSMILAIDYYIQNTGRRPLHVNQVSLVVEEVAQRDGLLEPAGTTILRRDMRAGDPRLAGLFQVEPGERSIFTIRARMPSLPEFMFITCSFSMPGTRNPSAFRSLYVRSARRVDLPDRSHRDDERDE
jgi:hypothetical protein